MFQKTTLPFSETGSLNKLVSDYISSKPEISELYDFSPDFNGYSAKLNKSQLFKDLNRDLLVSVLTEQAQSVSNTQALSIQNIQKLKNKNSYTVTTGHQLCLFTGPLYFIHKILSTINLSEWLQQQFPDKHFIPVYWMASEDHDFEEINHVHIFGKKVEWNSDQTGAVGNFKTSELSSVIENTTSILGNGEYAKELIHKFKEAYLNNTNLSDATRHLVNELFGKYGLVVLDGNSKVLKKEFASVFKEDIFNHTSFKFVNETIQKLNSNGYPVQVNPREINCFYMHDSIRNRIEKNNERYNVLNTSISFTQQEMEKLIEDETEKLSPNVVLRPLYQQHILPNIAYVGGPGELSYWLEYKAMFDNYKIEFPILQPRKFVMIVDKAQQQKLAKLNLKASSVFDTEKELIDTYLEQKGSTVTLDTEKNKLEELYETLLVKSIDIDKTLEASVKAELQKSLNSIQAIEAKLNKALKQRSDTELNQIKTVKAKLFPENIPQERYDNLSTYYSKWGMNLIDELKKNLEGIELNYNVLLES